jgi:hypothetical protein
MRIAKLGVRITNLPRFWSSLKDLSFRNVVQVYTRTKDTLAFHSSVCRTTAYFKHHCITAACLVLLDACIVWSEHIESHLTRGNHLPVEYQPNSTRKGPKKIL